MRLINNNRTRISSFPLLEYPNSSNIALYSLLLLSWFITFTAAAITSTEEEESCSGQGDEFLCPDSTATCNDDAILYVNDCLSCDGHLSTNRNYSLCFDRKLFSKYDFDNSGTESFHYLWNDILGAFVWFINAGLATSCGVGGGTMYVVFGIILLRFAPKQAAGLSMASMAGATLAGSILNVRNQHPNRTIRSDPGVAQSQKLPDDTTSTTRTKHQYLQKDLSPREEEAYIQSGGKYYTRPLINYDIVLFVAPMEMAGAILGVIVQQMLPNWLYLCIAIVILFLLAIKTYHMFYETRAKERLKEREKELLLKESKEQTEWSNSEQSIDDESIQNKLVFAWSSIDVAKDHELQLRIQYLEQDMVQYPWRHLLAAGCLWCFLLLIVLLKGGKGVDSLIGITCESPWFMVLTTVQFLSIFSFGAYFGWNLVSKQSTRVAVRYPYLADDPVWDWRSLLFFSSWTFVAGFFAGLVGDGGGVIMGPLMLHMGICPSVSTALTAFMIMLTSSSVTVIYIVSGLIPISYAVFYFMCSHVGACFVKSQFDKYVQRSGRRSTLVFVLATVITATVIGIIAVLCIQLSERNWCLDGFSSLCHADLATSAQDGTAVSCKMKQTLQHGAVAVTSTLLSVTARSQLRAFKVFQSLP